MLGDLGRYPLLTNSLTHTFNYHWWLKNKVNKNSLIAQTFCEMSEFKEVGDCWLSKVEKLIKQLGIREVPSFRSRSAVSEQYKKRIQSKFDRFWLDEVNKIKLGPTGSNSNKLRLYSTFKGNFASEPYIETVRNRNSRQWLTRLRISAHHLQVEVGRYASPPVPEDLRLCRYCNEGSVDNEKHFLLVCKTFSLKRQCFLGKLSSLGVNFGEDESLDSRTAKLLCPANGSVAVCTNKYIRLLFKNRKLMDDGLPVNYIGQRTGCPPPIYPDLNMSRSDSNMSLESVISDDFVSSDD